MVTRVSRCPQVPNQRQTPPRESPNRRKTTSCRGTPPHPTSAEGKLLSAATCHLAEPSCDPAGQRDGCGRGDERDSPWMLGGFLFRAIFSLVPSPRPAARSLLRSAASGARPPGFRELFVAAMACARRRRPGCALGSARLCCAGAAAPPLPAASPPHALRWPRWPSLLCGASAGGRSAGSSERQPSAHLPRLRARPPHAPSSPHAEPSVPWAPLAPGKAPLSSNSRLGLGTAETFHSARDRRKLVKQAPARHSCLPRAPWSSAN